MFLLWYSFFRRTLVDKWKSSTIYELLAINNYWFMVSYLMVMLISPALNSMIGSLDSKQLLLVILSLYAVDFGGVISSHSVGGGFATLMMIYLVARWMRLYLPELLKKHSVLCFLILLLIQLSLVSACYLFQHIGIKVIIGSYDNIVNILIVGFLVITIEKYHFHNKFINYVALSTLRFICFLKAVGVRYSLMICTLRGGMNFKFFHTCYQA